MSNRPVYNWIKSVTPLEWFITKTTLGVQIRLIYKSIVWFGFWPGCTLYWRQKRESNQPVEVRSSELAFPVHIRGCTSDPQIFVEVMVEKVYSQGLPAEAKFIVDAGANIGLTSVYFANRYPSAQIVAIEPSDSNMEILRRNIQPYPNIRAKLAGLWPYETPLRIVDLQAEAWGFQIESCTADQASLIGVSVDGLLVESGFPRIDILKIDIEGSEWPLLYERKPEWLVKVDNLMIELHQDKTASFQSFVDLVQSYGLELTSIQGNNYNFSRQNRSAA